MADLHVVHESNFRDVVKTIRKIADEIERGDFGEVKQCGIAIFGEQLNVFGAGPDAEAPTIALLFSAAHLRLARAIEEHGK